MIRQNARNKEKIATGRQNEADRRPGCLLLAGNRKEKIMSELERIAMQANLTETLDNWIREQEGEYNFFGCSELARMMASAALAVLEASTRAEAEAER